VNSAGAIREGLGCKAPADLALGGVIAVTVSLLSERAHRLALEAAARIIEQLARVVPVLLAGFTRISVLR
jgi:hypothetical protein